MEQGIMEHLHLTGKAVAAMDAQRLVVGGPGIAGRRGSATYRRLNPMQHGFSRGRTLSKFRFRTDTERMKQALQLPGSLQPRCRQRIEIRIGPDSRNAHRQQALGARKLPKIQRPAIAQGRAGMDQVRLDVTDFRQRVEDFQGRRTQGLQSRDQQTGRQMGRGGVVAVLKGFQRFLDCFRWTRHSDGVANQTPQFELPTFGLGNRLWSSRAVGGARGQKRLAQGPPADHLRSTRVVVIEAVGDTARQDKRATDTAGTGIEFGEFGQERQNGRGQAVHRPRIVPSVGDGKQEATQSAGVEEVHPGHDTVREPAARTVAQRQFRRQPCAGSLRRHHHRVAVEQARVGGTLLQPAHRRLQHCVQIRNPMNCQRHGMLPSVGGKTDTHSLPHCTRIDAIRKTAPQNPWDCVPPNGESTPGGRWLRSRENGAGK